MCVCIHRVFQDMYFMCINRERREKELCSFQELGNLSKLTFLCIIQMIFLFRIITKKLTVRINVVE